MRSGEGLKVWQQVVSSAIVSIAVPYAARGRAEGIAAGWPAASAAAAGRAPVVVVVVVVVAVVEYVFVVAVVAVVVCHSSSSSNSTSNYVYLLTVAACAPRLSFWPTSQVACAVSHILCSVL